MTLVLEEQVKKAPLTQKKYGRAPPKVEDAVSAEGSEVAVCLDGREVHKYILVWVYPISVRSQTPQHKDIQRYRFDEWEVGELSERVLKVIPYPPKTHKFKDEIITHHYSFEKQRVVYICDKVRTLQKEH